MAYNLLLLLCSNNIISWDRRMNLEELVTGESEAIKWFKINNDGNVQTNSD